MQDGNPGEIDFGSSQHGVQVSEGSSYRELTVLLFSCNPIGQLFPGGPGYSSRTCKMTSVNSTFKDKEA